MDRQFFVGDKVSLGAEHAVYKERDFDTGRETGHLIKFPHRGGAIWQAMRPELARRDLAKLEEHEIPHVPTELFSDETVVHIPRKGQYPAKYVLRQPMIEGGMVGIADLRRKEIADQVFEIIMKGEEMYRKDDLGMDLLGGKALWGAVQAMVSDKITTVINNLLVDPDGKVLLCDTRLYDFEAFWPLFRPILRANHNFQYEVMRQVMGDRGYSVVRADTWANAFPRQVARGIYFLAKDKLDTM